MAPNDRQSPGSFLNSLLKLSVNNLYVKKRNCTIDFVRKNIYTHEHRFLNSHKWFEPVYLTHQDLKKTFKTIKQVKVARLK